MLQRVNAPAFMETGFAPVKDGVTLDGWGKGMS
jgi:hypothetical protein